MVKNQSVPNKKTDLLRDLPYGAFLPFFYLFPEDLEMKTRKIMLLQDMFGLAKGEYFLIENYCTDTECVCEKVMINVVAMKTNAIIGTVGFGWESSEFYTKWLLGDKEQGRKMVGAYIEVGGIQTGLEKECLALVQNSLLDTKYVELIKKRNERFKNALS